MFNGVNFSVNHWVVIPAAGSGQRMKSSIPKQYLKINEKTILEHTLSIFVERDDIAGVTVCVAPNDSFGINLPIFSNPKVSHVVGGDSRAESVLNGLSALSEKVKDDDWVLVHDAARPCLSALTLQRLFDELEGEEVGGILAIPAQDTLKLQVKGSNAQIDKTLDRSTIWQAQTPQMFRYKLLKDALSSALEHNIEITDEASALEMAGYQPRLIEGEARNQKITQPEDFKMAEFFLK